MKEKAKVFKALSDETRLRLMNIFLVTDDHLCVCEMVDALQVPQYQVSKHLAHLRHMNFLTVEKVGTWSHYAPDWQRPENAGLFEFLKTYLKGEPFESDRKRLETRLLLREQGKCVVGFVSPDELNQLIKNKMEYVS